MQNNGIATRIRILLDYDGGPLFVVELKMPWKTLNRIGQAIKYAFPKASLIEMSEKQVLDDQMPSLF